MRSFLSIFLLLIFAFGAIVPGAAREEFTKLSVLWKHYQLHKAQQLETTFITYLQLHYGDDFIKHSSAHDHSRLPMKSGGDHLHAPVPVVIPAHVQVVFQMVLLENHSPGFKNQIVPQSFLSVIWQPPRSC